MREQSGAVESGPRAGVRRRRPIFRWFLLGLALVLLVAFSLVVSEVTMTPPPLAPDGSPGSQLSGNWRGSARIWLEEGQEVRLPIFLKVKEDGTVTGSVGKAMIKGRLEWNRSWLGKRLDLRTDYIIVGSVTGYPGTPAGGRPEKLAIPLTFEGAYFRGALWAGSRGPSRVTLFRADPRESYQLRRNSMLI
jgi:hypothetical protein